MSGQVATVLNDFMRVEAIEEGLSCFLVQRPETDRMITLQTDLSAVLSPLLPNDKKEELRQYLNISASMTNTTRLHLLLKVLHDLVQKNVIDAQMVCECILSSEKLSYKNGVFWIECFNLIRKIIRCVDYKGVRDVMKICKEKVQTLPIRLTASVMPQMKAVESVLEHLFDRSACLLPAYLLISELMKTNLDGKSSQSSPHWKLAPLISNFIESFRPTAQMVSIIGHTKMLPVVMCSGASDQCALPWRLDTQSLKLPLIGSLPWDPHLLEPQRALLHHVLDQLYSRDMVCSMLELHKRKDYCPALENQLVELVIVAMERAENDNHCEENSQWMWLHLSSQIIYFAVSSFVNFNDMCLALCDKLAVRTDLRKGRDHLMFVMLQFLTGSLQKNTLSQFLGLLKIYDLLYPEKEPLPVPDMNNPMCTHQMAACCIWIHLLQKAHTEKTSLHRPVPTAMHGQYEFIQHLLPMNMVLSNGCDFRLAILCNAYSTSKENFNGPMNALVDSLTQPYSGSTGPASIPLSMAMLDAMTVHCKMTIINHIVTYMTSKQSPILPPALVETYSRLLVYTEIESLGVKGFLQTVLPGVFRSHAWGLLHILLEMFSYRIHHIQPHYRVQLLSHLHSLASGPHTNETQLHLCVESTALRLISGLGSSEVQPELSRFNDQNKLVSLESEELNRALVLTLARSMHITGTGFEKNLPPWCQDLLKTIKAKTPHTWANHTLEYFPPVLREFFHQNRVPMENQHQLKKAVEEEYRNWASMNNENDIFAHFSIAGTPPLFLCLLWKVILETDRVNPIAYKILERIGPRALSTHLRKFCEYLVNEFSASSSSGVQQQQHVNKCVDAVNLMIWKYNILTIDRLVLCLSMRPHEGQMCFFIIQVLLLKSSDFRTRVQEFVRDNSPDHWKQSDWFEKHTKFHAKYPENFAPEGTIFDQSNGASNPYTLPVYFGNVCLRFLPVFDNLIHRYLEMPPANKSLGSLLDHLGSLYKFHDRPVTYLYNTLHYYEQKVRENPSLKRRLVLVVLASLQDGKVPGLGLSQQFSQVKSESSDSKQESSDLWKPELDYFMWLIQRICDTMSGKLQFPTDWRFNEFPNPASHVLYVTCVELMALPMSPVAVGSNLLDVVSKGYTIIPPHQIMNWINAIGLVMAALPHSYWQALHERLVSVISCPQMLHWPYRNSPFKMFNFQDTHDSMLENKFSYTLAVAHSIWHHAGCGQIALLPQFVKEHLYPIIRTEEQLLFLCHLIGPFFATRNKNEPFSGTQLTAELTVLLCETLEQVDQNVPYLHHMDTVCDLLYHIKYMFVGYVIKAELLPIIKRLRPALQMRLRFLVHLSLDEIKGCG